MAEETVESLLIKLERLYSGGIEMALEAEVAPVVKDALEEAVLMDVYDYDAEPIFMNSRRGEGGGGIGDKSQMEAISSGMELTITDHAGLQNLFGGGWSADLATIVQNGSEAFHQPGPRPFMEDGVETAILTGAVDDALKRGLMRIIEVD